jgi:hypothetical protein
VPGGTADRLPSRWHYHAPAALPLTGAAGGRVPTTHIRRPRFALHHHRRKRMVVAHRRRHSNICRQASGRAGGVGPASEWRRDGADERDHDATRRRRRRALAKRPPPLTHAHSRVSAAAGRVPAAGKLAPTGASAKGCARRSTATLRVALVRRRRRRQRAPGGPENDEDHHHLERSSASPRPCPRAGTPVLATSAARRFDL